MSRAVIAAHGRVGILLMISISMSEFVVKAEPVPESSIKTQEPGPLIEPSDAQGLGLEAAIEIAEENSPNLREAAAEVESSRGRAVQAGLYPNPSIQGGAMQLAGNDSQYFSQLSQEIITKGKRKLDRSAALREVEQAELRFVRTRFDLLTAVRQNFYATLTAQRRVEVLHELVRIAQKSQSTAVRLQEGGEGTPADTLLLDIELERASVGHENALAMLDAAKRQLAASMGVPELAIQGVQGDLTQELPDYAEELIREGVLSRNALIQIAQVEVERSRILLRRAEVEPFPNITIGTGYMFQVPDPNNIAILQVGFPIPVWNRNQGNIQAARASISRSTEAVTRTQNELLGQLANTIGRYRATVQQVKRYEEQILPKARQGLDISQRGYQSGQFDFLRLLQAQRAMVEADLNYVNAQEMRWNAAAEIAGLSQDEYFPPPISAKADQAE